MKSWLTGMAPVSYLQDPGSNPRYASFFLYKTKGYCINKVILTNVIAAAESQLVKVCASLVEAQGSIPLSLTSFYFSKLKHRY